MPRLALSRRWWKLCHIQTSFSGVTDEISRQLCYWFLSNNCIFSVWISSYIYIPHVTPNEWAPIFISWTNADIVYWHINAALAVVIECMRILRNSVNHTPNTFCSAHYSDVIMNTIASQIPNLTIVYSIVFLGADQRKHQSSASLAFVRGIHRDRWISRTKGQLRGKMFPFDDVIMGSELTYDLTRSCWAMRAHQQAQGWLYC